MANDDIYGSKKNYERFTKNLARLLEPPAQARPPRTGTRKYYVKNPGNLRHFKSLCRTFEARDISYIRRLRLLQTLVLVCHLTTKDLAKLTRDDVNQIMATAHNIYKTPRSKETFIAGLKHIYKTLFPETDQQGRPDETIVPYAVRHLSRTTDKSRARTREDKLTWEEYEQIINYFANDPRIQAYLTLAVESLRRPQEILYRKIKDVEQHDSYAKIHLTSHGKEGPGLIQCIDSHPYLTKWLNQHPLKHDPNAYLFINTGNTNRCQQLRPENINKLLRKALKDLQIQKPITCYSLKRNGVTIRRLRGETDMEIQHAAGWTSTKQLQTYDLTNQDDAFKKQLQKRGLIPTTNKPKPKPKTCHYCQHTNGATETTCQNCKRPLNRQKIREQAKQRDKETAQLQEELHALKKQMQEIKTIALNGIATELLEQRKPSA